MGLLIKAFFGGLAILVGMIICIAMIKKSIEDEKNEKRREQVIKEQEAAAAAAAASAAEFEKAKAARRAAFEALVNQVPRAAVDISGEKGTARDQNEIQDIKYNTITARTNAFNLEDFVVLDIETTGLRKRDAIVSVGAVAFEGNMPVRAFYTLVDPGRPIPPEASAVNGLNDEDLQGAPSIWQIMPGLQGFVGELPIVGHNLPFDLGYLYRYGFDLGNNKRYDTLALARKAISKKDIDDYKLGSCCHYFDVEFYNAHNSLFDSYATGQLFIKLVAELCNK